MPYVPVPKDLTHVRQKVLFNLTRRQLVCFLGGALVGAPLFYLLKPYVEQQQAIIDSGNRLASVHRQQMFAEEALTQIEVG